MAFDEVEAALGSSVRPAQVAPAQISQTGAKVEPSTGPGRWITSSQVREISRLLKATRSNVPKFKEYMGVASVGDIPQADFPRAKAALQQKEKLNGGARR